MIFKKYFLKQLKFYQMKTRIILFFVFFCFMPMLVNAQVQVSLSVLGTPSSKVSDWVDNPEMLSVAMTVTNTDPNLVGVEYRVLAELSLDGSRIAGTVEENVPPKVLGEGTEIFQADEVIPSSSIEYDQSLYGDILASGYFPAGEYLLCVKLVRADNGAVISVPEEACVPLLFTDYQLPELLYPDEVTIGVSDLNNTIFNWTPITPNPTSGQPTYVLAVTEVLEDQTPEQAFSINKPVILREVGNVTSYNWPVDINFQDIFDKLPLGTKKPDGKNAEYVWSIKPLRPDGTPYKKENGGYVAVASFTVGKGGSSIDREAICECFDDLVPDLSFSIPDTANRPRELKINGVEEFRQSFLGNCGELFNGEDFHVSVRVDWLGEEETESSAAASTQFNYPFYLESPDTIAVRTQIIKGLNLSRGTDIVCEKVFYVEVPEEVKVAIDTTAQDITFYSNYGGAEEFEFFISKDNIEITGSTFSGNGTVYISWLRAKVAVHFDEVLLNVENKVIGGEIVALIDPNAPKYPIKWGIQATGVADWANETADEIDTWLKENLAGTSLPYHNEIENYTTAPVKMPLGLNFAANQDQLAITEMVFDTVKPLMNFVAAKSIPQSWSSTVTGTVGFIVQDIEFSTSGIETFRRAELIDDITFHNINHKVDITFLKPTPPQGNSQNPTGGCYLEWGEEGFSKFGLQVRCDFSRNWLTPVGRTGKSSALFTAEVEDWDDIVLEGELPESEIVGTNGIKIVADDIVFDMSDTKNANNMVFPKNYVEAEMDTSINFKGFYAKEISLELPRTIASNSGRATIEFNDMIINDMGVTLDASVTGRGGGSGFVALKIADLSADIDTFKVSVLANSLKYAMIKGDIKLPISSTSEFDYEATFHAAGEQNKPRDHLQIAITPPDRKITAQLFRARMQVDRTSNISAYVDSKRKTFTLDINASLSFTESFKVGGLDYEFPGIRVENFGMSYVNNEGNKNLSFNEGNWSFASPQKSVDGFNFSMTDVGFEDLAERSNELFRGKIQLGGDINLTEDIAGGTTFGLTGVITENFVPRFEGASIDKVRVKADLPAVYIEGELEFYEDDNTYGDGFKGNFTVDFSPISLQAQANILFGKKYIQEDDESYRYWYVNTTIILPDGIPFLGPLAFRGFGGGAYYNMRRVPNNSGYKFFPFYASSRSSYGLIAQVTVATIGKESSFNADAKLEAVFGGSSGLQYIEFTGDLFVAGGISEEDRKKAKMKGSLEVSYDFTSNTFHLGAEVDINVKEEGTGADLITGNASLALHLEPAGWYLHVGTPNNLNRVNVWGVQLYEYFMCGNMNVNPPTFFTPQFRADYKRATHHYPEPRNFELETGPGQAATLGEGFAFGLGWKFEDDIYEKDYKGYCDVEGHLMAGAEVNLALLKYRKGYGCDGINGWRVQGSLGVYGSAEVSACGFGGFGIGGGAWVYAEFPNPYYVTGAIDGYVDTPIPLCDFDFHYDFELGTKCAGGGLEPSSFDASAYDVDSKIAKRIGGELISYTSPNETTGSAVLDAPISVKYNFDPERIYLYKVPTSSDGSSFETREFRIAIQTELIQIKIDTFVDGNTMDWKSTRIQNPTLEVKVNNLGEYSYYNKTKTETYHHISFEIVEETQEIVGVLPQDDSDIVHVPETVFGSSNPFQSEEEEEDSDESIYYSNTPPVGDIVTNSAISSLVSTLSQNNNDDEFRTNVTAEFSTETVTWDSWEENCRYHLMVTAILQEKKNGKWESYTSSRGDRLREYKSFSFNTLSKKMQKFVNEHDHGQNG